MTEMVSHLSRVMLGDDDAENARYGRTRPRWDSPGPWVGLDTAGEIVAVFEAWNDGLAKPTVVFGGR